MRFRHLTVCLVACFTAALFIPSVNATDQQQASEAAENKAQVLERKAADNDTQKPPPKAQTITKIEAQAVDPVGEAPVDDALTCLSRTIYWEAKGGAPADMEAVASVVLNRLGHDGFPDTVCGVVKDGSEKKSCQFSWWCDGRPDDVQEENRYEVAKEIARKALNQQLSDRTGGAMYFHDRHVSPVWVKQYIRTAETGKFLFYKPRIGEAK
jgi:spore germination cell wall hydrolase CwlJ-like protein